VTLTAADAELVETAAADLDGIAGELRHCHTPAPKHDNWAGDEETKVEHDRIKLEAHALFNLADRIRLCVAASSEEVKP
jgi:hypothetical protein